MGFFMPSIPRLPMNQVKRRRLAAAQRRVDREVSMRSLRFPSHAIWADGAHLLIVDVMTDRHDETPRKLCQLILSKEALLRVLQMIPNVRRNGERL